MVSPERLDFSQKKQPKATGQAGRLMGGEIEEHFVL